nr:MAG TPA: hypothetical protein [Caudoviricetes sp.]
MRSQRSAGRSYPLLSDRNAKGARRFFRERLTYPLEDIEGISEKKQDRAKQLANELRILNRVKKEKPYFIKYVFISHYLHIPYENLDPEASDCVKRYGVYPKTFVEELFAASNYLMRQFELAPFASDDLEDKIIQYIQDGKL